MKSAPDCVVLSTDVRDTSILIQQLTIEGFKGTFIGSDGSMDPSVAANGGVAAQGMLFPSLYNLGKPSERMKAFKQAYFQLRR